MRACPRAGIRALLTLVVCWLRLTVLFRHRLRLTGLCALLFFIVTRHLSPPMESDLL